MFIQLAEHWTCHQVKLLCNHIVKEPQIQPTISFLIITKVASMQKVK